MFSFLSLAVIEKHFPLLAKRMARHREARFAARVARLCKARHARPRLEVLEDRIVPDAYGFEHLGPNGALVASSGSYTAVNLWWDQSLNAPAGNVPGANDTADIPVGASCTLDDGETARGLTALSVEGSMTLASELIVSGTATVSTAGGGAGSMTIGSSNSQEDAKLDTNTFTVTGSITAPGTVTVGGPSAVGSSAELDAVFLNVGTSTGGVGLLNIGDPGSGHSGSVDVSNTMNVFFGGSTLNVGGVNGSGGTLDVQNISSAGIDTVNTNGEIDIKASGTFTGFGGASSNTVTGEIKAENINDTQGATVAFAGSDNVVSGTGKLVAEINASFTVTTGATLTLLPDSAVGGPLNDGRFIIDGSLVVDTNFMNINAEITLNNDGGATTLGSITGTGSIDWWNTEFEWNGGLIAPAGGFTIDGNSEFKTAGPDTKTLGTDMTVLWAAEFGGTGSLIITGGNTLLNITSPVVPLSVSLPLITGAGTFINAAKETVQISSPTPSGLTIAALLDNEGSLDCETGAGPLTLSNTSGSSILNGSLALNNDSLTISGVYKTTLSFDEDWSPSDLTTLTGTLTVDSGASADFDHMVIAGGVIAGAGDFSIGSSGLNTGDYLDWQGGTMSGTGTTTIGPYATLSIPEVRDTLDSRTLDNHGTVSWAGALIIADSSGNGGPTIHNEKDGTFDVESGSFSSSAIPRFTNDGMLEVGSGVTLKVGTFTQSSTGTLQSDIASASSFGVLSVTGTATLDGTLQANLENGYQPPSGTSFKVLTFGSSSGQFATVKPDGWSAEYDPTDVTLVSA